jgi:hypothetical protein
VVIIVVTSQNDILIFHRAKELGAKKWSVSKASHDRDSFVYSRVVVHARVGNIARKKEKKPVWRIEVAPSNLMFTL